MRTRTVASAALTILAALLALACIFPFFWMLRSSFMGNIEIYQYPPRLLPTAWRFENYPAAMTTFPFGRYFANTLTITLPSVFGVLLTSTMAAFALARLEFPFKKWVFACVIGSMLMPATPTVSMCPLMMTRGPSPPKAHSPTRFGRPVKSRPAGPMTPMRW